jgi:hypothetical protein
MRSGKLLANHFDPRVKEYQELLATRFRELYPGIPVQTEWAALTDEREIYSPRLDIAVGPFATHQVYAEEYDYLMDISHQFIKNVIECHLQNVRKFDSENSFLSFEQLRIKNQNARCFLAIEIENRVSRKHLMGGAINVAALGRVGFAIAWTPDKLRAFVKLRKYLSFLGSVGKNTFDTTNLLILDSNQMLQSVETALRI